MKKFDIKYSPLVALGVYFGKIMVVSPNWQDLGVVAVLSVLSFGYQFKTKNEKEAEILKKIEEFSKKLTAQDEKLEEQDKQIAENRQYVSNIKMAAVVKGDKRGFGFGG